jgi:hypothetical protein
MRESESGARVQILQDDDLLERDTHPKGEKQDGLTESEHHCTIVPLYSNATPADRPDKGDSPETSQKGMIREDFTRATGYGREYASYLKWQLSVLPIFRLFLKYLTISRLMSFYPPQKEGDR